MSEQYFKNKASLFENLDSNHSFKPESQIFIGAVSFMNKALC